MNHASGMDMLNVTMNVAGHPPAISMLPYLYAIGTGLYWTTIPVYWLVCQILSRLVQVALFFTAPLLTVLGFLAQPLVYFGYGTLYTLCLPFVVAKRLEIVYIYLGIGGIVGVSTALFIHQLARSAVSIMNLQRSSVAKGPTAKEHRQARMKKSLPPILDDPFVNPPNGTNGHQPNAKPFDKSDKIDRAHLSALPRFTLQAPSPDGKRSPDGRRSLLDQTLDEDADSDL